VRVAPPPPASYRDGQRMEPDHWHGAAAAHASTFSMSEDVYILFDWWHATGSAGYACSLAAVYAACVAHELLLARRRASLRAAGTSSAPCSSRMLAACDAAEEILVVALGWGLPAVKPRRCASSVCRLAAARTSLSTPTSPVCRFAIMLVLMTFNGGIFCVVTLGVASGRRITRRAAAGRGASQRVHSRAHESARRFLASGNETLSERDESEHDLCHLTAV